MRRLASDGASAAFSYAASVDQANELRAQIETAGGKITPINADSADSEAVKGLLPGRSTGLAASTFW